MDVAMVMTNKTPAASYRGPGRFELRILREGLPTEELDHEERFCAAVDGTQRFAESEIAGGEVEQDVVHQLDRAGLQLQAGGDRVHGYQARRVVA